MGNLNQGVDLVYLWVDGNDPDWIRKKKEVIGKAAYDQSEINCRGRYLDNEELKYSLRSVEKHIPWIRKIFIVTDDQTPGWLNTSHQGIRIIDHQEILPEEAVPCFNSMVIEHYIYRISGLSEQFLYANDDMFLNADLKSGFFFATDGFPIIRLKKKPLGKWHMRFKHLVGKEIGQYRHTVEKAALLVEKQFGSYYSGVPHHNIDAYKKTDYRHAVEKIFHQEVLECRLNKLRTFDDLYRSAFDLYALAMGHAHLSYVNKETSLRMLLYEGNFEERLKKYNPKLFCMNDGQKATEENREEAKRFLEHCFPEKSSFEL